MKNIIVEKGLEKEQAQQLATMEKLIKELNQYNYEYYTLDKPTVSDDIYDLKYGELLKLEIDTNLSLDSSPTHRVGDSVLDGFEKVKHKNRLWSLDKTQTKENLKQWIVKMRSFALANGVKDIDFSVIEKFDGLTMTSEYASHLKTSATRGNGEIGEDVTEQSKTIINLPQDIGYLSPLTVHGEVLMTKKAFKEYNGNNKDKPLRNLRNGAAGALRNLDLKESAKRKLTAIFYDIKDSEEEFDTYEEILKFIKSKGFTTPDYKICKTYEEIENEINKIEEKREGLQYDIDGVVIRVNNLDICNLLGYTSKFPKFAIAYKFEAEETTTCLRDVEWNVSKSGRMSPVAILDGVEIDGSTVSRATLNNMEDIERKGLKINGEVIIRKSNDVIPEILGIVDSCLDNDDIKDIVPPEICPSCEGKLVQNGAFLVCNNGINCKPQLIRTIQHYCQRDAMNIEGLSEKTIETFVDEGYLKDISDIYRLEKYRSSLIQLGGFGEKSVDRLLMSIEKSKECELHHLIYGLGIAQVGLGTSKKLANIFKTIDDFLLAEHKDMTDLGGVVSSNVVGWVNVPSNKSLIISISLNLIIEDIEDIEIQNNYFTNKAIVITGSFNGLSRNDIKDTIVKCGGIVRGSVSGKTDIVIYGDKAGSKLDKAIELEVETMNETKFINILD